MRIEAAQFRFAVQHALGTHKPGKTTMDENALKSCAGKDGSPLALRVLAQQMLNEAHVGYKQLPVIATRILQRYRSYLETYSETDQLWHSTPFQSYDRFADHGIYRVSIEVYDLETEDKSEPGETRVEKSGSGIDMIEI